MSYFITKEDKLTAAVVGLAALGALLMGWGLNYPPTPQELRWGAGVGVIRVGLWLGLGWLIYGWGKQQGVVATALVATSAAVWSTALGYPREAIWLGLFLASGMIKNNKIRFGWWTLLLGWVAVVNLATAPIWQSLKIEQIGAEVNRRITAEDGLTQKIEMPLIFRRLATNKVTVGMARVWKEVVAVADLETVFFGEINPLSRKMMPIFFWPGVVMFLIGLSGAKQELVWLAPGVAYFWLTGGEYYLRFLWLVPGLALVMSRGWTKMRQYQKWIGAGILGLYLVGIVAFGRDLKIRPDFWLNNRPLVYQQIYQFLQKSQFESARVTDILGDSQKYCRYYLKNGCQAIKFGIEGDSDYRGLEAGFLGEFTGKDINNKFDDNWEEGLFKKGYQVLFKNKMRDSVAYGYGDWIVVVKRQ